jgi:hypothetical protein
MSASETIERVVHGDADVQIGQPRRRLSGLRSAFMCPIDALSHVSLGHALPAALLVLAGVALDRRRPIAA